MSRAYQISISESVKRHIHVSDGIRTSLEILDVLPAGAMCDLLASELKARGFERDGDDMVRKEEDGVEIRVAVAGKDAGHVTVRVARDKRVEIEVEESTRTYEEAEKRDRERLQNKIDRKLEKHEEDERSMLSEEVAQTLERKLRDLRRELDRISNRVTAEALKVRAGQLGEIREISEDPETGSVTIKVRV